MEHKFTEQAKLVLQTAKEVSDLLKHHYIGSEHLLVALVTCEGVAAEVLNKYSVETGELYHFIEQLVTPAGAKKTKNKKQYTPRTERILEQSVQEAERCGLAQAGTEHILLAILKEQDCIAVRLLNTLQTPIQKLYLDVLLLSGMDASQAKAEYAKLRQQATPHMTFLTPTLDQYSKDLTELARQGKLDPVIGREKEIERVIQILSRRTKNNPCLMGEPGVGKTAIVEGIAKMIADGKMPEGMENKRLLSMDLSGMVAGTKYRGEFEERIKRVIAEATQAGNVLLFIDELHTIIGAGGAEGALDASNIMKPALARGDLQVIGATTREEYRKHIEKDAALERRFQPVAVEEPTEKEAIDILHGLRDSYEKHHQVHIADEALEAAVKLTERYIHDRFLPDKAIDVCDEASARIRLKKGNSVSEKSILEDKIEQLEQEKEEALLRGNLPEAEELAKEQKKLVKKLAKLQEAEEQDMRPVVTAEDVAEVISMWTKIPLQKLQEEESAKLLRLPELLEKRVVGQHEAVLSITKAIRRARVGLHDPNRPIGSFLFLGPTGVGKTELSKALAEAMFGSENAMIRVDMSEYMEKHSVSKMIGSPPGYVGHEEGGQLSEKVRQKPYSVVLFDELEKAHPDVFNILLQVLEDGQITDAQGRKVSFKNTIIIMTSNTGAKSIMAPKHLGFQTMHDENADYQKMREIVMEEVKHSFKPEFLNRIDEMIVFHPLNKDILKEIASIQLNIIIERCKAQMDIRLKVDDSVRDFIVKKGYDDKYGARPIKRAVQMYVEDRLAEEILEKRVCAGDSVRMQAEGEGEAEALTLKIRHAKKTED